ncbi:SMP-30/gluconolactonase/LRE family protein [Gordonia sp. OPL2]|uniref:SMP-30/gluconolactonase/LRE family protein n=1 Tax=Gordonia sp. OPL2 TaxID=2486274 RepID=UPI0021CC6CEA|nr:hypothetical protein [Gordonia sp. OPL2]
MTTALRTVGVLVGAAAIAFTGLGMPSASAAPDCPRIAVTTRLPSPGPAGWSENLAFDDLGNLWVSRLSLNAVERYDRAGRRTATVPVDAPGAVRPGPDGLLYVTSGNAAVNMLPGVPRTGRILRMNPTDRQPTPHELARGLGMPNGMAFGPGGNLYVADSNRGVLRIGPQGLLDEAWSARAPKNLSPDGTINGTGTNGIVVIGDDLYVTLTTSLTGRILRVPIDDPSATAVAADVTRPLPGLLDDLTALDDRTLVVTLVTGQIATVDLPTGRTCTAAVGQPVTAVAQHPGRPGSLVAGTESGALLSITLRR